MARKTKDDTEKTISAILDGAESAFMEKGVANATIADIAGRAGVSKGAVYGHFKGKVEVCVTMCERALSSAQKDFLPQDCGGNLETLMSWGLRNLRYAEEPSSLRNVFEILYLKCEENPEYEPILAIRKRWDDHSYLLMRRLIRRAIRSGDLPADLDVELTNDFLMSIMCGIHSTLWWNDRLNGQSEMIERMMCAGLDAVKSSPHLRNSPLETP